MGCDLATVVLWGSGVFWLLRLLTPLIHLQLPLRFPIWCVEFEVVVVIFLVSGTHLARQMYDFVEKN